MRRAAIASLASACAIAAGCNGLLGNAEHDVASDASALSSAGESGAPASRDDGAASNGNGNNNGNGDDASGGGGGTTNGTCTDACAANATRCASNGVETCVKASSGCLAWSAPIACASGACSGGHCVGGCDASASCGATAPPSCAGGAPGAAECGASVTSCCASPSVPAGSYARTYDGIYFTNNNYPAAISAFRLDQYEVTVGRFRPFLKAVVGGWRPAAGQGKHAHLNGGKGLAAVGGGYEAGWDSSWSSNLPATESDWSTKLSGGTWTAVVGNGEKLPISNLSWYEAYAFCIWDDGFLPSEAEWNYAAAGGSEQRVYPWSAAFPPGSTALSCAQAWYSACSSSGAPIAVGSESPAGDGKWGQSDLAGNLYEWTLDWQTDYVNPCIDCVALTPAPGTGKVMRGGTSLFNGSLSTGGRSQAVATGHYTDIGFRCARTP